MITDKREFRVYKPNNKNNGSALKVQFRIKPSKPNSEFQEPMCFFEISQQTGTDDNGNAQFDWASNTKTYAGKSVTMKMGVIDAAEVLLVLTGQKEFVGPSASKGIYHQNPKGSTIMKFQRTDKSAYMQLSTSKDNSYKIAMTQGECYIMKLLLEQFIKEYYGWYT